MFSLMCGIYTIKNSMNVKAELFGGGNQLEKKGKKRGKWGFNKIKIIYMYDIQITKPITNF
jgi:hypothetical protein